MGLRKFYLMANETFKVLKKLYDRILAKKMIEQTDEVYLVYCVKSLYVGCSGVLGGKGNE